MTIVTLFLLVLALVLFILAAVGAQSKWNLMAAGLAAWMLSLVISRWAS